MTALALLLAALGAALLGVGLLVAGRAGKVLIAVGTACAGAGTVLAAVAVA
jgi:hypothetical protein